MFQLYFYILRSIFLSCFRHAWGENVKDILLQNQTFNANLWISCVSELWLGLEQSSEYFWFPAQTVPYLERQHAGGSSHHPLLPAAAGACSSCTPWTTNWGVLERKHPLQGTRTCNRGQEPATGAVLCAGKHRAGGATMNTLFSK